MDTTFDYFHKQLTFRPDKGSRWEESPREFFIPFQRYYERYENSFRNYFEYNVFIYIYIEQASVFEIGRKMKRSEKKKKENGMFSKKERDRGERDRLTTMQPRAWRVSRRILEILAGEHGHVCKSSGTKTSGRGRNDSRLEPAVYDWAV